MRILAKEGPTGLIYTPKFAQLPHLYTTYEATYALKQSGKELFLKNCL